MQLVDRIVPGVVILLLSSLASTYNPEAPKPYGSKTLVQESYTLEELEIRDPVDTGAPSVCRPLYIGYTSRHGSRYPGPARLNEMQAIMDRIGGHILNPEYFYLNDYTFPFDEEEGNELTPVGYEQHKDIGERYATRLFDLLEDATNDEIGLYTSPIQRTKDSALGFREGLYNILGHFDDKETEVNLLYTGATSFCDKYKVEVDENPYIDYQKMKYQNGPEVTAVAQAISNRLELDVPDLTGAEMSSIFEATGYENGILGGSSWTPVWENREELEVMNYYEEFKTYYNRGYAFPITYESNCVTLERMFGDMDEAKTANDAGSSEYTKGTFTFGHSDSVVPFQCLLGLFNDSTLPITADNYEEQANRTFRINTMGPMASNVGFIMYECDEGEHGETPPEGVTWPTVLDKYMIQLNWKEIPTVVPNACEYHLCAYDIVREHFSEYIDFCNYEERCAVN